MGVHAVSTGIVIDDETLAEHDTVFVKFVTDSIELLRKSPTGAKFLEEFNPSKAGISGGSRYALATVLIRPPSRASITQIKSVAETSQLTYFLEDDLLFLREFCGKPSDTYLCGADFMKHLNLAKDIPKAKSILAKYTGEKEALFGPVCLKIPANTRGNSLAELQSNGGNEVYDKPGGKRLEGAFNPLKNNFTTLLSAFKAPAAIMGKDQLSKAGKCPAQVIVFPPGSTVPADFKVPDLRGVKIHEDGSFVYYGQPQDIKIALIHELLHAFYFLLGSETADQHTDEKRAVGLEMYKDYLYSENVFRSELGMRLRLNYPGLSPAIADDQDLVTGKYRFDSPDRKPIYPT